MKWFWLLTLLGGCSWMLGGGTSISAKNKHYTLNFSSQNWDPKKNDESDYVFVNKQDGRILLSNSFCKEFQDQPLDRLAKKTFRMVKDYKEERKEYTTFKDREAFRMEGLGNVDGVKVSLKLLNTRRNNCYFDFVSIGPANVSESDGIFDSFLKSVEFH